MKTTMIPCIICGEASLAQSIGLLVDGKGTNLETLYAHLCASHSVYLWEDLNDDGTERDYVWSEAGNHKIYGFA